MGEFFLKIVNMSISASWIVLAILLLRVLLKKMPKWMMVLLWGIVGIRLICPFSIESVISLIPSAETISPEIMMDRTPEINTGFPGFNNVVNPVISDSFAPNLGASANPLQIWIPLLGVVWMIGMISMLAYTVISYWCLKRKIGTAVLLRDKIFQSERVVSPFVLGIIKPKIYVPFHMNERDMSHVIAHEQAHIHRKDHWWKPLGFLLLTIHWFNPLMWLGYVLLCRDIELACDEKVVKDLNTEQKADYSQALLTCSVNRRMIAACPLAFGEVGVKNRVKSVLNYKKPTFWIVVVGIVVSVAISVCFLTNPASNRLKNIEKLTLNYITEVPISVFLSEGETYKAVGVVDKELLKELANIKISRKEISLSRGEDRDVSHTLVLQSEEDREEVLSSYLEGLYIHFNNDFTAVWVDTGVKPTLTYKVMNPQKARDIYERISDYPQNVPLGKKLTLNDVKRLAKKGNALSWKDFEKFAYVETGSGLYIRHYEIDEMFSLSIGGTNPDKKALYFYLNASDEQEEMIDIRTGDVEVFIEEHKDNPVVQNVTWGYYTCPVDNTGDNYNKMIKLGGVPAKANINSIEALAVVKITSVKELNHFVDEMKSTMNFDAAYPDGISFQEAAKEYTDEYFEGTTLFLIYASAGTSANRFFLDYATKSQGVLSIGILESVAKEGDTVMQGWLVCAGIPNDNLEDVKTVEVHMTSKQ